MEAAEAVRRGDVKATELLDEALDAIASRNDALQAFVHLDEGLARSAAAAVDDAVARGEDPGPFAGVPMGVKDLEDCAGMPTSHGSLLFKGRPPVARDSVHVSRLRSAGAVFVGKTAAPEFGIPCFTSTKAWGTTRNPWDPTKTPGGSSGGSAAAVASGMVPAATASDGGGSTRIPAAYCGLVGMKPTFGRIPHERPAPSMTSVFGLLCTTVADAARHLDVVSGPHDLDRTSLPAPSMRYETAIQTLGVAGLRATFSPDMGFTAVDDEVAELALAAADELCAAAGVALVDRPFAPADPLRLWLGAGNLDLWVDIERGMWPERADELGGLARSSLQRTSELSAPQLARPFARRWELDAAVAELFADVDVLITPTTALPPFQAEGPMPFSVDGREFVGGPTPFTMLANLCGNPAISLPAGLTSAGLPVGVQLVARRHHDEVPLRLGRIWEQTRPWPRVAPEARRVQSAPEARQVPSAPEARQERSAPIAE